MGPTEVTGETPGDQMSKTLVFAHRHLCLEWVFATPPEVWAKFSIPENYRLTLTQPRPPPNSQLACPSATRWSQCVFLVTGPRVEPGESG